MKMTNNISTFLRGLVVAFAMTLFMPSASHATWGNYGSNNSSSSSKASSSSSGDASSSNSSKGSSSSSGDASSNDCNKYKKLADKYLKVYYSCYNYKYYRYYLYYMKKYKLCLAEGTPTTAVGSVCGFVFEDSNDNGKYDKYNDKALANVKIKVTDSKGKIQTVTTGKWGYYTAKNVATGTASVKIVESTLPSSSNVNQVVGSNPTNVTVEKNCEAWEERNGYTFGVKFGSICGFVFEDTDCDGKYNKSSDKALANVKVKVTDAEGNIQTVTTGKWGYYGAENLAVGTASVEIVKDTLPDNLDKNIAVGTDPTDVEIEANCEAWEEKNGYCKVQTGEVCGVVYHDTDRNGKQNGNEIGIAGIEVVITSEDTSVQPYKVTTDNKGNYCKKDILAGPASVEVTISTLPTDHELTAGENPNTITVLADDCIDAGKDGYTLPVPPPLQCPSDFTQLDMSVWTAGRNDSNNLQTSLAIAMPTYPATITFKNVVTKDANDHQQAHEQFMIVAVDSADQVLDNTIYTTDINNDTHENEVSDLGTINIDGASELILVHRADPVYGENLAYYNSVTFTGLCYKIEETAKPLGSLSGVIDLNRNHIKDVTVTVTDSNGDEHILTTDSAGKYSIDNLPIGSTTVIIDTSTIPYDDTTYLLELDIGLTENTVEIEENENTVIYTKYRLSSP